MSVAPFSTTRSSTVRPPRAAVRVAEPLLAHLRSTFNHDSIVYVAPPQPLGGLWHYTVEGLPRGVPIHQVVRVAAEPGAAAVEAALLRAAYEQGFPAPEVVVDGRDFVAMSFESGEPLPSPSASRWSGSRRLSSAGRRSAATLGVLLAELHRLDPSGVAVEDAVGIDRPLRVLEDRLAEIGESTLYTAYERLIRTRPVGADGVMCHGGLEFSSVRQIEGRVTGVVGWSGALIADAAYDVGATLALLRATAPNAALADDLRSAVVRAYTELLPIDRASIGWYEALHCLRLLTDRVDAPSASIGLLADEVTGRTGIDLVLPV